MRKYLLSLNFILLFTNIGHTQKNHSQSNSDSIAVLHQLNAFVVAFRDLDFEQFQRFFSTDVTVFFPPSAMVAQRINGKDSVMRVFKNFFDKVRKSKPGPPYLDIDPQKLEITLSGDIAIISFELADADALSRRTIIMRKEKNKFLICHLHASKIDNQKLNNQ